MDGFNDTSGRLTPRRSGPSDAGGFDAAEEHIPRGEDHGQTEGPHERQKRDPVIYAEQAQHLGEVVRQGLVDQEHAVRHEP